jgi:hypothetical protein
VGSSSGDDQKTVTQLNSSSPGLSLAALAGVVDPVSDQNFSDKTVNYECVADISRATPIVATAITNVVLTPNVNNPQQSNLITDVIYTYRCRAPVASNVSCPPPSTLIPSPVCEDPTMLETGHYKQSSTRNPQLPSPIIVILNFDCNLQGSELVPILNTELNQMMDGKREALNQWCLGLCPAGFKKTNPYSPAQQWDEFHEPERGLGWGSFKCQ